MARSTAWRADLRRLRYRIENLVPDTLDQAEEIMDETVQEGAAMMRRYIETRGTERSGKTGRIETGSMRDNVEHNTQRFAKSVRGEFGWGVAGGRHEDYYEYQEHGFRWMGRDDIHVPPMHALLDATIQMREKFFARMRREMGAGSRRR